MKYLFCLWFAWIPFCASAQKEASSTESQKMITDICNAAGQTAALQCDFKQTKQLSMLQTAMVSQGKMYYKEGRLLRWEYTSPYTYVFVLNDNRVMMKSPQHTNVVDVRSSKMFQQIARIMMNSITGKSLSEAKDFNVSMYTTEKEWLAKLIPQQKELKQFFDHIWLHIDPTKQMVVSVELVEKGGDTTSIRLTNVKKNTNIDNAVFKIE